MAKPVEALEFLSHRAKYPAEAVCAVFGDEPFLQRQALGQLRQSVLGSDDGEFSLTVFSGRELLLRDVLDELATVALFGSGKRLVVIEEADEFVTQNRPALEDYVARPRTSGVLVLVVKTWPASTKLYKAIAESGLQIECKFPSPAKLCKWLVAWSGQRHLAKLEPAAAEQLVELVEPDMGLLDQELAKLAALAGAGGVITANLVREAVGTWRTKTAWDMIAAVARGNAKDALLQLERLLLAGEAPIALLGQIASTLRRFAAAARLVEQAEAAGRRVTLRQALEEAGFKAFVLGEAESQLRQIGRARGVRLYRWLLETDLAIKGTSSAPLEPALCSSS